jgi:hypothetical protein
MMHGEGCRVAAPFVLSWCDADNPLPVRPVRPRPRGRGRVLGMEAPPWLATGPADQPFDFCAAMRRLCADVAARCPELRHVDVAKLLFAVTQARSGRLHGLQARLTPLRFRDGQLVRQRRGVCYQVQRYLVNGQEMLYLVTFCLPRFLDQSFDDKCITLFHELYHISPCFDGDLRRYKGRCALHTHSKRRYDAHMADLARAYLADRPDPDLYAFLRLNFAQLQERLGSVVGAVVPRPRIIPVTSNGQLER